MFHLPPQTNNQMHFHCDHCFLILTLTAVHGIFLVSKVEE